MKVLMINGSPRKDSNTEIALKEIEAVLKENGIESKTVQVGNQAVRGCAACGGCKKLGKCVFDDVVNQLARDFEEADGLIVASPVYYASANGTLISVLDRLFHSTGFDKTMKVGAAVAIARRGGLSSTFDMLNNRSYYIELLDMQRPNSDLKYPRLAFEHAPTPDQYDPEATEDSGSIFEEMMSDYNEFDGDDSYDDEF